MVRKCAVRKCSNGLRQLDRWRQQDCSIHGLKYGTCICHQPFYLFGFPSEARDPNARKEWIKLVNRQDKNGGIWQPKAQDRVCSEHFIDREPTPKNPYPTLKLGYSPIFIPMGRKLPNADGEPTAKRSKTVCSEHLIDIEPSLQNSYPTLKLGHNPHSTPTSKELPKGGGDANAKRSRDSKTFSTPVPQSPCNLIQNDHNYDFSSFVCTCKPSCSCTGCQCKQKEIQRLRHEVELLKVENAIKSEQLKINSAKERKLPFPQSILKTDIEVKDYTGLPSKAALQQLSDILKDKSSKMRYRSRKQKTISTKAKKKPSPLKNLDKKLGRKRKLSKFEELVLVLMKLRLALPMGFLGSLFGISKSTCSSIFNTWIKFLASELNCLVLWPGRDLIRNKMPDTVKKLCPTLHCILDSAEFNIEKPLNLHLQALTLSDYKNNNAKVLLGIASNGMITFLLKEFGGKSSVKHVTLESGFHNLLDPGDTVIADREFPIQNELIKHHCALQIPSAAQGFTQMTKEKVKHAKTVANPKVHVKTATGHLKHFQILKKMPGTLFPLIYEIVMVCAALTNLMQIHHIL